VTDLAQAQLFPKTEAAYTAAQNRVYGRKQKASFEFRGAKYFVSWDFTKETVPHERKYRFTLGQYVGYLCLDLLAEALLLGGERNADLLPRELRYLLVAETLHPLVQATERGLGLKFEWDPKDGVEEDQWNQNNERAALFQITREEDKATCSGLIEFENGAALGLMANALSKTLQNPPSHPLEWLQFPLSFCIGKTRLTLDELHSIERGDIINIDERPMSSEGMLVEARINGRPGIEIIGHVEGFNITVKHWRVQTMAHDNLALPDSSPDSGATNIPPENLGGLEVPLRFEIGDLSVSLADLKHLQPGFVFELPQPISHGTVRILAHGNVLGKGYLVAIGDRLGVRVTEFVSNKYE